MSDGMEGGPYVSPGALTRVEEDYRRELAALKEWVVTEFGHRDDALKLQAVEYERRLDTLNNENGRIAKVLENSIPRETFEQYQKSQATALDTALAEQRRTFEAYKLAEQSTEAERAKAFQLWKDEINSKLASQAGAAAASAKTWALIMAVGAILVNLGIRYMTSTK
jgi:predicted RNase H-like nuclease (RuvC/YqgF family)